MVSAGNRTGNLTGDGAFFSIMIRCGSHCFVINTTETETMRNIMQFLCVAIWKEKFVWWETGSDRSGSDASAKTKGERL